MSTLFIEVEGTEEFWYMFEKGPLGIIGEVDGEKEKFCWNALAELMMESFSMKVSRANGTPTLLGWCGMLEGWGVSRE